MSLQKLNLSGNKFISIPSTLSNLPYLTELYLRGCDKLKHLLALPKNLWLLEAVNCLSLESESVGIQMGRIGYITCTGCPKLDVKKIERDIIRSFRDEIGTSLFCHTGEFPLDLVFYGSGSRLSFVVPDTIQKIRGSIAHAAVVDWPMDYFVSYEVVNKTKGTKTHYPSVYEKTSFLYMSSGEVLLVISENGFNIEGGDEMEFVFDTTVKKCGIKLIYEGDEKALKLNDQMYFA